MKPLFDDPKEQALIEKVALVFLEKGMKAMTMDDIAVELHVSKKTLYKYVKNRAEFVSKCVKLRVHRETENRSMLQAAGLNAIEENLKIMEFTSQVLSKSNPQMHSDLERYFPDAFQLIEDYKNGFLFNSVLSNIKKGISEGLYCKCVNAEILAKMYIAKIDLVIDGKTFPANNFTFKEVIEQVIIHNMRGMATHKGLALLEELTGIKYE